MDYHAVVSRLVETVRMSEDGGIVVPVVMREAVGLKPGDDVIVELEDGRLRVMPGVQGIPRAQRILRAYVSGGPSLADELLAERRAESARD